MDILDKVVGLTQEHEDFLLSYTIPAIGISSYLLVILVLKLWMDTRKEPFNVKFLMAGHNFFLCVLSFAMALGSSYEAFYVRGHLGLNTLFCSTSKNVFGGRLFFWCLVFYLSKFYEFFDTVLLLLRKRPLLFLHVWHHCAVSVLALVFLRANMTFFFTGVLINGTIHTFTYWFYFQNSLGNNVWWKKYLTVAQMIQFVWGMGSWLPWPFVCTEQRNTETDVVVLSNFLVLGSFLLLFLNFFNHTYADKEVETKGTLEKSRGKMKKVD
jgi:fatty acid elongase 3